MLEVNKVYKINEHIILRGINKKFWALNSKSGSQFKLNELSYDILSLINGKNTLKVIFDLQLNKYNVEKDLLVKDINDFINKALEKGIIIEELGK